MERQTHTVAPLFDLVLCLAQAVDLVSPLTADHHERTSQIAYGLGRQLRLPEEALHDLVIAAALHDVGGLTREVRQDVFNYEYHNPYGHPVNGYLLLKSFGPFARAAEIVCCHHVDWQGGAGAWFQGRAVPLASHLLHLADRVAVLIDPDRDIFRQVPGILSAIRAQSGQRFVPEHVQALEALARKEAFWLDAIYMKNLTHLGRRMRWPALEISQVDFLSLSNLFRRIIDFRSPFTATHSAGVAATAEKLARLHGFSNADCWTIHLSGLLHDLGKLAVPAEVLEKPGRLNPEEGALMRRHTYYTYHILEPLRILDDVRVWGALHHERLDGQGYPFHLGGRELPLGSRIVSVADMFTALTEDRPYRSGIGGDQAWQILADASTQRWIDGQVVALLREHLEDVNDARSQAQLAARGEYTLFVEAARSMEQPA